MKGIIRLMYDGIVFLRDIISSNDAILFGILALILGAIFYTSKHKKFADFYKVVPALLLCYMIPALLNWPLGIVSKESNLYFVASRYLLPASLILLCLSIDLKGIYRLGPKAIVMFLSASIGIILGGPLALLIFTGLFPNALGIAPDDLWRGLSTVAGSWIGGGANQAAMKEVFEVGDDLFGVMIVIDVIVANIWMAFLLSGARVSDKIDKVLKADNSSITALKESVKNYRASVAKMPTTYHMFLLLAIAFGGVGVSHFFSDIIAPFFGKYEAKLLSLGLSSLMSGFFWLVVFATTIGVIMSFTKAKKLEGVGASNWGSIFIYILVATIGMKMDLGKIFLPENLPLFGIGIIWMLIHIIVLLGVAYIIKAPFFFVAVGSQANIGGAASAPVVASAFDVALAPVGVLMAVIGYALGTYGAIACALLMQSAVG
jgi:uncharacterized membrane protein